MRATNFIGRQRNSKLKHIINKQTASTLAKLHLRHSIRAWKCAMRAGNQSSWPSKIWKRSMCAELQASKRASGRAIGQLSSRARQCRQIKTSGRVCGAPSSCQSQVRARPANKCRPRIKVTLGERAARRPGGRAGGRAHKCTWRPKKSGQFARRDGQRATLMLPKASCKRAAGLWIFGAAFGLACAGSSESLRSARERESKARDRKSAPISASSGASAHSERIKWRTSRSRCHSHLATFQFGSIRR